MAYQLRDHYYKKAKDEGFAARSVFKLQEIDRKHRILAPGLRVLDLGAAPGSWSQFASTRIGSSGQLVGIDLQPIEITLPNARFVVGDMRQSLEFEGQFDVVLSDMAPRTTGIRITDQARSFELCMLALETARKVLRPGGSFVCKFFFSEDFGALKSEMQKTFAEVVVVRPDSTRKQSIEVFLVGKKSKGN